MNKRHAFLAAVAFLCGGVLGWFVGGRLDPTHAQIRAAAEALVPDGATVIARGENTGHQLIVGDYFASLDFDVVGFTDLDPVLGGRAHALGYRYAPAAVVNVGPGGATYRMIRKPLRAELTAFTMPTPDGKARGNVRVEADPESKRDRRMTGAAIGSIGLAGLTLLLIGGRRRYRRSGQDSGQTAGVRKGSVRAQER